MGAKVKAPKTKLNASDAVHGYIEAMEGLVLKHAEGIFAYAKKTKPTAMMVGCKTRMTNRNNLTKPG